MTVSKDQITIVIPTLNEEESIAKVIQEAKQEGYRNILVVDGYSRDKTVEIAKKNGADVIKQNGHGKCEAIKTAIENVETPYMLAMDAGLEYDVKDIEKLLQIDNYDCVISSRDRKNVSLKRRLGSWIITRIFNSLFGKRLKDVCSGMYMLRTEYAKQLEINTPNFCVEVEIAAQTANMIEIPVGFKKKIGDSNLSELKHGLQIITHMFMIYEKHSYDPMLSIIGGFITAGIIILSKIFFNLEPTPSFMILSIGALLLLTWGWPIIINRLKRF